jgi:hypothetical protein
MERPARFELVALVAAGAALLAYASARALHAWTASGPLSALPLRPDVPSEAE